MELTKRELEVLEYLCNGYSDEEIAEKFFLSISTVRRHIFNMIQKLNCRDRTQLVVYYFKKSASNNSNKINLE